MDKSLGTLLRFWDVFQFTQVQPLPSPQKQCWTRVSRIFSEFQLCIGWGEENCKEISKMMNCFKREPRNDRKIYEYCSTGLLSRIVDIVVVTTHLVRILRNYYILTLNGKNLTTLQCHSEQEVDGDRWQRLADPVLDVSNHQLLRLGQYSLPVGEVSQK